jgi:hypothetical protein
MIGTPRLAEASSIVIQESSAQRLQAPQSSHVDRLSERPCTNPLTSGFVQRRQYFRTETPIKVVAATRRHRSSWTLGGFHSTAHSTATGTIEAPIPHDKS